MVATTSRFQAVLIQTLLPPLNSHTPTPVPLPRQNSTQMSLFTAASLSAIRNPQTTCTAMTPVGRNLSGDTVFRAPWQVVRSTVAFLAMLAILTLLVEQVWIYLRRTQGPHYELTKSSFFPFFFLSNILLISKNSFTSFQSSWRFKSADHPRRF